jgi:hypothetical protein
MGTIVIRTRFDEGTESAEVATSGHFTDNKSCQIIESILKYKNGFKNNLLYKEIFN